MASDIGYADDGDDPGEADEGQDPGYGGGGGFSPGLQTLEFRYGRDHPGVLTTALGHPDAFPDGIDRHVGPAVEDGGSLDIGALLNPAIASALSAPPGALTRGHVIDRTVDLLHQILAGGRTSPGQFGDLVGRSLDFLTGLPEDEAGVRRGLAQLSPGARL